MYGFILFTLQLCDERGKGDCHFGYKGKPVVRLFSSDIESQLHSERHAVNIYSSEILGCIRKPVTHLAS